MRKSRSLFLFTAAALLLFSSGSVFGEDAGTLFTKGAELYQAGDYETALTYFKKSAESFAEFSDSRDQSAYALLWAGLSLFAQGNFTHALPLFAQSESRARERDFADAALSAGIYQGQIHLYLGKYNLAAEKYEQALKTAEEYGYTAYFPSVYQGLGDISVLWGKYEEADRYYRAGLSAAQELDYRENIIALKQASAKAAVLQGEFDTGITELNALLEMPGIEQSGMYGSILNNLGTAFMYQGKNREALEVYHRALEGNSAESNPILTAQLLTHIGGIHQLEKDFPEALDFYTKALHIMEDNGIAADQAVVLANMGDIYREQGEYPEAEEQFEKSITIKDALRRTAAGRDRIDYLASEIKTYHRLVWTRVLMGEAAKALRTAETSQAKYLSEQIGLSGGADNAAAEFLAALPDETIYMRHLYSTLPEHLIITADSTGAESFRADQTVLGNSVKPEVLERNLQSLYTARGITVEAVAKSRALDETDTRNLDDLLQYYYYLLLEPGSTDELRRVGRILYDYLLAPVEDQLAGKSEIIFALDGLLHFIPMETLIMPDGRYLAEKYTVSYVPSMQTAALIEKRHNRDNSRKVLVMGGADYSEEPVQSLYTELGYTRWPPLPGTLREAREISEIFEDSILYTGEEITEHRIKELSASGTLETFRVIHLAAHGLVLTDTPDLSALVLSQGSRYNTGETEPDGYLSMAEISRLKLAAEFVNLSACETGLGRLYGGEGIVGLTQAFLAAGAASVSASLWQVADESTALFMARMYRLAAEREISYKEAVTLMKREFIDGGKYSHPYFWAPFVYYGTSK